MVTGMTGPHGSNRLTAVDRCQIRQVFTIVFIGHGQIYSNRKITPRWIVGFRPNLVQSYITSQATCSRSRSEVKVIGSKVKVTA